MKNRRIGGFLTLALAFFLALVIPVLSPVPVKAQEPEGKPFTVTVQLEDGTNSQLIGEYDTFHQAMGVCGQGDLTKQYVITLNRDYTIPRDEAWWAKQDSNIVLKSKGNNQYTLKREGDRGFFTIGNTSKLRLENIILDGNGDGRCCSMFNTSMLTLGKGAVIQNCIDGPVGTDGPAIFVTGESHLYVEEGALVQNNQSATQGGVIQVRNGASLTIKGGTFRNNATSKSDGGAIAAYGNLEITGGLFEANQAGKVGGAIIYGANAKGSIKNATFKNNKARTGGAIYGSGKPEISNCSFEENEALWGGALFVNKGAKITDTRFTNNLADYHGGAIYTNPYEYNYKITKAEAYQSLETDAKTLFKGNRSAMRLCAPPENYGNFTNLQFDPASDVKHDILEEESLLNNYDVNYINPYLIIRFDPNGGSGEMENGLVEFDGKWETPLDYKLPQNGFTPPPGKEFQAWEILDKEYKEGSTYSINKDAVEGKGYILVKALWKSKPTTPTTPTNPTTPTGPEIIGGEDRVETGEKVSQRFYTHADNVIVVRKDEFPDALTASVLARALDAPILLTSTDHLDAKTAAEIRRLGATKAYIIGKENAIAESTAQEVKKITGKIERIGGSDRYETSSLIAKKVVATIGNTKKAVIATGQDFADALSISPYAAKMGYPILLVKQNQLPSVIQKTIKDLSISGVYVAGGDKAVSKSLDQVLPKILARFDGENRYDTAGIVAETLFAHSKTAFLASGQVFADALVISPVAAREDGPVLLTRPSILPAETKAAIDKALYEKIFVVGLEKAINKTVWESFASQDNGEGIAH